MSGLESPDATEGIQFLGSSKVQNSKGSIRVTVPADAAAALGLEQGDRVIFCSRDGNVIAENANDLF